MANNSHKYFLQIDGLEIIDFKELEGFPDMRNFLFLSLFTGLFEEKKELFKALKDLGLIHSFTGDEEITIVKSSGTAKTGFVYKFVTDSIMYKTSSRIMSASGIETFLINNRKNYEALSLFFERYAQDLDKLISYFELKIRRLESIIQIDASELRKKTINELNSRKNSLSNFRNCRTNIDILLAIIGIMGRSNYQFDRDLELDYLIRIGKFVDLEVNYIKKGKRTPNYRGIVKLAIRLDELLKFYPDLSSPYCFTDFHKERILLLECYKKSIIEQVQTQSKSVENLDHGIDPDSYMFLEEEDFEKLLSVDVKEETRISVKFDIDNLRENQVKRGTI